MLEYLFYGVNLMRIPNGKRNVLLVGNPANLIDVSRLVQEKSLTYDYDIHLSGIFTEDWRLQLHKFSHSPSLLSTEDIYCVFMDYLPCIHSPYMELDETGVEADTNLQYISKFRFKQVISYRDDNLVKVFQYPQ
jgi:hypothetical protein